MLDSTETMGNRINRISVNNGTFHITVEFMILFEIPLHIGSLTLAISWCVYLSCIELNFLRIIINVTFQTFGLFYKSLTLNKQ